MRSCHQLVHWRDPCNRSNAREVSTFWYWVKITLATMPPTFIISTSLQLDFANHATSVHAREDLTNPPTDLVLLEVAQAPTTTPLQEQLTTGVVIPASLPFTFKCPYFSCTLLAWLLTNLAVVYLLACGWLSDFGLEAANFVHTFYVLVCGLPMVLLSLVMVALLCGEVEKMWTYGEQWWSPAVGRDREGIH